MSITRALAVEQPALEDPGAGQHQRGARLRGVRGSVLAEVPTALRPVVPRGVHDDEVGGTVRILKHTRQSLRGQWISVALVRRRRIGQRSTKKRILVGDRIVALLHSPLPARARAVEGTAIGGGACVLATCRTSPSRQATKSTIEASCGSSKMASAASRSADPTAAPATSGVRETLGTGAA